MLPRVVCLHCKIPLLTSQGTSVVSPFDQGDGKARSRIKASYYHLYMLTRHEQASAAPACPVSSWWLDTECLVTSCLLFHTHVSMARVMLTSAVRGNLSLSFQQTLWVCTCVCPLIGISKDVWARLPRMALVATGGQCMCTRMSMHVCECVCVYFPGGGGLGPDCNDNGEEFKWEKKRDQGRLQGGWKRLWHHCYSSPLSFCLSISLLQIPCSLSLSWLLHFSQNSLCLPLLILSQLIPYLCFLCVCLPILVNISLIVRDFSPSCSQES